MTEERIYYRAIEENLAPAGRVYRSVTKPAPRVYRARRAVLALAACLAVAALALISIPEARAAVLHWLKPAADPSSYLDVPKGERTPSPALDAAVEPAGEKPITLSVTGAQTPEWEAWAGALSVSLEELLYDGETLYIRGYLAGNTADLVKPAGEYDKVETADYTTMSPPEDMVLCTARYGVNAASGAGLSEYWMAALNTHTDFGHVESCLAEGRVPISLDLPVGGGLLGEQSVTLELLFGEMGHVKQRLGELGEPERFPAQVALLIEGLTFDSTAGTEANYALPRPKPAALKGEALVFFAQEDAARGTALVWNERLSLAGGTLRVVKMQQTLTGTEITFHLALPGDWGADQCGSFARRISVEFVVNGESRGGFGSAYMGIRYVSKAEDAAALGVDDPPDVTDPHNVVFTVETGLMPADWKRMDSLEAYLCAEEVVSYNGVAVPDNACAEAPYEKGGWSEDAPRRLYEECVINIK